VSWSILVKKIAQLLWKMGRNWRTSSQWHGKWLRR
jgi:hypothetical protein